QITAGRSEEHTSELQSHLNLVCRLLLEKKKKNLTYYLHSKKKKNKNNIFRYFYFFNLYNLYFSLLFFFFFFFNDTATTEIYTLSLHDALPSCKSPPMTRRISSRTRGLRQLRSGWRSEEHTSELQSHLNLVCRLLLEKKK